MTATTIPPDGPDLYACRFADTALVVDYRTGQVSLLTIGREGEAGAGSPAVDRPLTDRIRDRLGLSSRVARSVRVVTGKTSALSFGADESEAGLAENKNVNPTPVEVIASAVALAAVLLLKASGPRERRMRRLTVLLGGVALLRLQMATVAEAERGVLLIRRMGRWIPGRVACLEESVAATVALALLGRSVTWCHGVASDPVRLHAWVQTRDGDTGIPVAEPTSTGRYTILRTIPEDPDHEGAHYDQH
ncbi:lasso peptide biosynthesis B2 protein [Nocardioides sp. NPDC057767]|uniref:lasso peptide biosynthesis B2 protein n=1 Tax=unclassified Nocardioides TaxID=2615069 RepID=UPI0033234DB4